MGDTNQVVMLDRLSLCTDKLDRDITIVLVGNYFGNNLAAHTLVDGGGQLFCDTATVTLA